MTNATVDLQEAAKLMVVHPKTVLDLIKQGVLPAARIGRAFVLMRQDVIDYVEAQIIKQTAERMGGTTLPKSRRQRTSS